MTARWLRRSLAAGLLVAGCGRLGAVVSTVIPGPAELWLTDDTVLRCARGLTIGPVAVDCDTGPRVHRVPRSQIVGHRAR